VTFCSTPRLRAASTSPRRRQRRAQRPPGVRWRRIKRAICKLIDVDGDNCSLSRTAFAWLRNLPRQRRLPSLSPATAACIGCSRFTRGESIGKGDGHERALSALAKSYRQ
jgi:hypothetical protein